MDEPSSNHHAPNDSASDGEQGEFQQDLTLDSAPGDLVSLEIGHPIWNQFFCVAPLVVIGTTSDTGEIDFAPKHMVTPLGWQNYFGFVCTPQHRTYQNIVQNKSFTVSYVQPDSLVLASLAASPRCGDETKPVLNALPSFAATKVSGRLLSQSFLYLECELDRIVDGFGENSLIAGRIVAAHIKESSLRSMDRDDQDLIFGSPMLAYLPPGRYATIESSNVFPFPSGFTNLKENGS